MDTWSEYVFSAEEDSIEPITSGRSPFISRYQRKTNQKVRRVLHFESSSSVQKQIMLPPILINGIKIDFESSTKDYENEKCELISKISSDKYAVLNNNTFSEKGSLNSTPILDTPRRKTILEHGKLKSWPVIGEGSFGTVIQAKYRDKKVAVKIVSKSNSYKEESLTREKNALQLSHPNIIRMIEVINSSNSKFGIVVMELWLSIDLQRFLDVCEHKLTFHQKVSWSLDVCQALKYCHQRKVLHLDVKPKNILIHKLGWASKICDFGSSISMNNMETQISCQRNQGTIKYMAPELLKGSTVTEKADVYSLGITMWQLLNEKTPYMGEDLQTIIYKVVSQHYRPNSSKSHSEHKEFVDIYEKCWLGDHCFRPSTTDLIRSLSTILKRSFSR